MFNQLKKFKLTPGFSFFTGLLTATLVIIWIWLPEFSLWYVRPVPPSTEVIERSKILPSADILQEIAEMDLKPPADLIPPDEIIKQAESVTEGILKIPGFPDVEISPVFSPNDLNKYPQLFIASLAAIDQLLDAYELTHREKFFELAKKSILAFAHFESKRLLDTNMLWNDHSIGARISVLIKFWAQYRQRTDFDFKEAQTVFKLIARSGLLLAKPEHYAWRTGHGIIADLALLQISAAFPFLEESDYFHKVAMQRLAHHIPYYVNQEGVTLLHSAGYHIGGVRYLAMAMRLYTLNNQSIPADWWDRYQKAEDFYALMRRPDGTLPMFGDTTSDADLYGPSRTYPLENNNAAPLKRTTDWPHRREIGLYPAAGHAIWWYPRTENSAQAISQTVTTWSYYPGLGHKLADELSMLIWAEGRNWVTNTGYWPYGFKGRLDAESWGGSNAPHLVGETASSDRSSSLLQTGFDQEVAFIEMIRNGPENFGARREVLQVGASTWVVLDRFQNDAQRETETLWTFYPGLIVNAGKEAGSFKISAPDSQKVMYASYQTGQGRSVKRFSGSWAPFSGWVVIGQTPVPANSIALYNDAKQGWQLAVFSIHDRLSGDQEEAFSATLSEFDELNGWTIDIVGAQESTHMTIVRKKDVIEITSNGETSSKKRLNLIDAMDPSEKIVSVLAAVQAAAEGSVRQVPLIPYRLKVSYVLIALLVAQEMFFLMIRRRAPRLQTSLRAVSTLAWVGVGIWLTEFYFIAGR